LLDGSLGFCGEESAGATFNRLDGSVWTTDKDGIVPALLSAEITACLNRDIADLYHDFEHEFGETFYELSEVKATRAQRDILQKISPKQVTSKELAGEKIETILSKAPGNDAAIGGLKIITKGGWCAMRPSGTEDIYKIYAESFHDAHHLRAILTEAQVIVNEVLKENGDSRE
jgi:phosphoglucomutase